MIHVDPAAFRTAAHTFGQWLLSQTDRDDAIGRLAQAAKVDRGFPRQGTVDEVSCRLNALGADGDMHQALEDAALDWHCY